MDIEENDILEINSPFNEYLDNLNKKFVNYLLKEHKYWQKFLINEQISDNKRVIN